jgi:16S rRNA (guanine527-N7)-methyltransferase
VSPAPDQDLAALAERFGLDGGAADRLERFLALLATEHAPTTVRARRDAMDQHLADALVALEVPGVAAATVAADLGTGAGVPGIPLAIALPHLQMHLVESVRRKCAFLEEAVDDLGLANATVVCDRAETWVDGRDGCDLVTTRALAALPVVLEYAAPLLRQGGTTVAWRGARDAADERAAARAAAELGLQLVEVRHVQPFSSARDRHLHVYVKVEPTPERFPRRPGMAVKRPLGG